MMDSELYHTTGKVIKRSGNSVDLKVKNRRGIMVECSIEANFDPAHYKMIDEWIETGEEVTIDMNRNTYDLLK